MRINLVYIKVHKTGSSTLGGVMRRIAARRGLAGVNKNNACTRKLIPEPKACANHARAALLNTKSSLSLPVVHITSIREPVARALSYYYHLEVNVRGKRNRSADVIGALKRLDGGWQWNYINYGKSLSAESIVAQYDVIVVTERMLESLVVFKYALGLPSWCDLVFISAKVRLRNPDVPLAKQPEAVRAYAASPKFRRKLGPDLRLHAAASAALDRWIRHIGHGEFARQLAVFGRMLNATQHRCQDSDARWACYWGDNGCHYPCLDAACGELEQLRELS